MPLISFIELGIELTEVHALSIPISTAKPAVLIIFRIIIIIEVFQQALGQHIINTVKKPYN